MQKIYNEQLGLCVYCGRWIDFENRSGWHVEHFRPQSKFSHLALDYKNLFVSCNGISSGGSTESSTGESCGHMKEDWWFADSRDVIEPEYPECVERFRLSTNGEVFSASTADWGAKELIERLGLNDPSLVALRRNRIDDLDDELVSVSDYFDSGTGLAMSFAHLLFQRAGKDLPLTGSAQL